MPSTYGDWPYIGVEKPENWGKVYVTPGGFNHLVFRLDAECWGNYLPWSCYAFNTAIVDAILTFNPEWGAHYVHWNFWSHGGMERRRGELRWHHQVSYFGVIKFEMPIAIVFSELNIPPEWWLNLHVNGFEDGPLDLDWNSEDDRQNPPERIIISDYNHQVEVNDFDMRERISVRLDKQLLVPDSHAYATLCELKWDDPTGNDIFQEMVLIYNAGLSTANTRVYTNIDKDIRIGSRIYPDLNTWPNGQDRDVQVQYPIALPTVSDIAALHRGKITLAGPQSVEREDEGVYYVDVQEPDDIAFELQNARFQYVGGTSSQGFTNIKPVNGSQESTTADLIANQTYGGKMVVSGTLKSEVIFKNNPVMTDDDETLIFPGGQSSNELVVSVTPRDWNLSPTENLIVSDCLPLSDREAEQCPPTETAVYPYKNLVHLSLIDDQEDPAASPWENLLVDVVDDDGPCDNIAYVGYGLETPYIYNLQPYMYSDVLNQTSCNLANCPSFMARQEDGRTDNLHNELNVNLLNSELEYAIGRAGGVETTLVPMAIEIIEANPQYDVGLSIESYTDKIADPGLNWKDQFKEDIRTFAQATINNVQVAIENIDYDDVSRQLNSKNAEWPEGGSYPLAVYFTQPDPNYLFDNNQNVHYQSEITVKAMLNNILPADPLASFTLTAARPNPPVPATNNNVIPTDASCQQWNQLWRYPGGLQEIFTGVDLNQYFTDGNNFNDVILTVSVGHSGQQEAATITLNNVMRIDFARSDWTPLANEARFFKLWSDLNIRLAPDAVQFPNQNPRMVNVCWKNYTTDPIVENVVLSWNAPNSQFQGVAQGIHQGIIDNYDADDFDTLSAGGYLTVSYSEEFGGTTFETIDRIPVFALEPNYFGSRYQMAFENVPEESFVTNRRPRMEAPRNNNMNNFEQDDLVMSAQLINFATGDIETKFPVDPQPVQHTDYEVELKVNGIPLNPVTVPLVREESEEETPTILSWHTEYWTLPAPNFTTGRNFHPILPTIEYTFNDWDDANWTGYNNHNVVVKFTGVTQTDQDILRQE
ncbi:hypothetical protein H8D57_01620, partial [bacterium]|nr:hypothetical protein [bacterium]